MKNGRVHLIDLKYDHPVLFKKVVDSLNNDPLFDREEFLNKEHSNLRTFIWASPYYHEFSADYNKMKEIFGENELESALNLTSEYKQQG